MGSLWACSEGMDGLSLLFTGANVSDLAAWAGFGTLTLFERRSLLQYDLLLPNSSTHVAILYLGPMGSLWAYIEGVDGLSLHFAATNSSDLAAWALGQVWHFNPLRKMFAPPVCIGAPQFFYACCNIVFGSHGEPLGIY